MTIEELIAKADKAKDIDEQIKRLEGYIRDQTQLKIRLYPNDSVDPAYTKIFIAGCNAILGKLHIELDEILNGPKAYVECEPRLILTEADLEPRLILTEADLELRNKYPS